MKVILFQTEWRSFFSMLICAVTRTRHSHAALEVGNFFFDADGSRGNVGALDPDRFLNRRVEVYSVEANTSKAVEYVEHRMGERYDYAGILGWLFKKGNAKRAYCFEYVVEGIDAAKGIQAALLKRTTSGDVLFRVDKLEFVGSFQDYLRAMHK